MGYFEFQLQYLNGMPRGKPEQVNTETGVILRCPSGMETRKIRHLCSLARNAPDHPVDIVMIGAHPATDDLVTAFSAQIHWRET